jgi:hypothetical protein
MEKSRSSIVNVAACSKNFIDHPKWLLYCYNGNRVNRLLDCRWSFFSKDRTVFFNATYSSVTTGKYLIIFVDWGKKVGDAPQRSRERKGKIQMPKLKN